MLAPLVFGGLVGISNAAQSAGAAAKAHIARTLQASDTAHLRYISAKGSALVEEGKASGTLPGNMKVHFVIGATFTGSFTISTHSGSITGHGAAAPHGAGVNETFAGSLTVTSGTGRYKHAHGQGGLSGTFNRNNYALTIKTSGKLSY